MKLLKKYLIMAAAIVAAAGTWGQAIGTTAITTGSHLRVREGPSLTAAIITEVDKGVQGEVLDAPDGIDWVKLRIPSANVEGWVHRDYLEFPGMPQAAAPQATGDTAAKPKSVPYLFAEVSNADGRMFIHGHFQEELPVLLLDSRQVQVWRGKTIAQGMFEDPAYGIFPITDIGLEMGERLTVEPILAVVGYPKGYAPLQARPISDRATLRGLDERAHAHSKSLVKAEVDKLGARLARAAAISAEGEELFFLVYQHPHEGDYEPIAEHSYLVLRGNQSWHVNARCGEEPILFRLNGRFFMAGEDRCCDCGGRAKYVVELTEGGLVYRNADWSL